MKIASDEKLEYIEDISPEAAEEVGAIMKELEEIKLQATKLNGEMEAFKAKAEYLNKMKWSVFDKYHPKTNPVAFNAAPGIHAIRRYDWAAKQVAIVSHEAGGSLKSMLEDVLDTVFGDKERKEPKASGEAPKPTADDSAVNKQSTPAPAETAEAGIP